MMPKFCIAAIFPILGCADRGALSTGKFSRACYTTAERALRCSIWPAWLGPLLFETNAHVYVGEDDFVGLKLETERDLLLTQKLIMQPFVELDVILNDQAANAKKPALVMPPWAWKHAMN